MKINFRRSLVHMSMVGFALFIGRIPAWAISMAAFGAFIFNLFILPRIGGEKLHHPQKEAGNSNLGLLLYPLSLSLVSLIFFNQQVIMGIAWGAMAFGDAFASITGHLAKGPAWPWNKAKRLSGTIGFFLFGSALTLGLLLLLPDDLYLGMNLERWIPVIVGSVAVAALVESLPALIDDNFSVPMSAAIAAFFLKELTLYGTFFFPTNVWLGLFLTILFMVLSWASGKIDLPGTLAGGVIAFLIFLGGGFPAMGLLLVFFVGGTAASLWKRQEKKEAGLFQENEGKRSVNNALCNAGVAAFCGACAWIFHAHQDLFLLMLLSSMAAALGDTLASELGNLYGKRYINILSFKQDQRGNDGAISLEGSVAGLIGTLLMVGLYTLVIGSFSPIFLLAILAGFSGVMIDSVLGASLQQRGYLSNDTVNFSMTLFAALFSGGLYLVLYRQKESGNKARRTHFPT